MTSNEGNGVPSDAEVQLGNISVDFGTFEVMVGDKRADLTFQEFELLRHLTNFRDRIVAFDELGDLLWGDNGPTITRRLNVLVCRLRPKLRESRPYRLETVRGRGYGLLSSIRGRESANGREGGPS